MQNISLEGNNFIYEDLNKAAVVFSTAENDFNVYCSLPQGKKNMDNIKKWFNITNVGYLKQCHSDKVHIYDGAVMEGDALITDKPGTAVGIFTADCVPVLIYDASKNVAAAVHSGWRGTYSRISAKTVEKMISYYGCNAKNMHVYIGPHMRDCCYEVGSEVIEKFSNDTFYNEENIFSKNNLSMEKCIIKQLKNNGIPEENIISLGYCTGCCTDPKLYSYRKGEKEKRLFSLIYIK